MVSGGEGGKLSKSRMYVDEFEFSILPLIFFFDEEDKDGPKLNYDQPELIVLRKTCNLKD